MRTFRHPDELRSPEPRRMSDVSIMRFDDLYEVDPRLMDTHVTQQTFPNWDMLRIAAGRHDHLEWMHRHWAGAVVSGAAVLRELDEGTSA